MDNKKFIFWSILVVIIMLFLFQWELSSLEHDLKEDCKSYYNINESCPCSTHQDTAGKVNFNVNFSEVNLTVVD
jgi:hypothetical protein